jgi:hypothetical protein
MHGKKHNVYKIRSVDKTCFSKIKHFNANFWTQKTSHSVLTHNVHSAKPQQPFLSRATVGYCLFARQEGIWAGVLRYSSAHLNLLKPKCYCVYHQVSQKFCILPTMYLLVFFMDFRTNSNYFSIQHCLIGLKPRQRVFTARYGLDLYVFCVDLITNSDYFSIQYCLISI